MPSDQRTIHNLDGEFRREQSGAVYAKPPDETVPKPKLMKIMPEPALVEKILTVLRAGNRLTVACRIAKVDRRIVSKWIEYGTGDDAQEPYATFVEQMEQAVGFAEARDVQVIDSAARAGDWRAAAFRLERMHPEAWGKRDRVEVTGDENAPITIQLKWPSQGYDPEDVVDAEVVNELPAASG